MGVVRSFSKIVHICISSADPAATLQKLSSKNIALFDVTFTDEFTVDLKIRQSRLADVKRILRSTGSSLKIKQKIGLFWKSDSLSQRPVFLVGIILLMLFAISLSSRIFFLQVDGNSQLSSRLILEKAQECGIRFGTLRRIVRSEKMKNALLAALPELQWAGINTSGCTATIHVIEKEIQPNKSESEHAVSSIVASRDGVITSCTVYKGTALCQPGQAVKAGQMLVSGYSDCGITIMATAAEAEITAQTIRTSQLISPSDHISRGDVQRVEKNYSLLVGKKLINFYKDSGICHTTCVKMYKEDFITLPGGHVLPVALVTETVYYYEASTDTEHELDNYKWLIKAGREYLTHQMVAGEILSDDYSMQMQDSIVCLKGTYFCLEMIGQLKYEENMYEHGKYF